MAKAKKEMADKLRGTPNHDLSELVGKKIKEITLCTVAVASDGSDTRQFYRIKVAGRGENEFVLACDRQARATLMYPDDFEAFLTELHDDAEVDEDEDDDVDLEPDGDESIPANLFDEIESEDDEEEPLEDEEDEDDDY